MQEGVKNEYNLVYYCFSSFVNRFDYVYRKN